MPGEQELFARNVQVSEKLEFKSPQAISGGGCNRTASHVAYNNNNNGYLEYRVDRCRLLVYILPVFLYNSNIQLSIDFWGTPLYRSALN